MMAHEETVYRINEKVKITDHINLQGTRYEDYISKVGYITEIHGSEYNGDASITYQRYSVKFEDGSQETFIPNEFHSVGRRDGGFINEQNNVS
jgi:hypothetical protein